MAEYIEREAAIKALKDNVIEMECHIYFGSNLGVPEDEIEDIVNEIPVADVEPVKHGKWVSMLVKRSDWKGNMQSYYQPNTCSECHVGLAEKTNYCPNCGAKMDGKEVQE